MMMMSQCNDSLEQLRLQQLPDGRLQQEALRIEQEKEIKEKNKEKEMFKQVEVDKQKQIQKEIKVCRTVGVIIQKECLN